MRLRRNDSCTEGGMRTGKQIELVWQYGKWLFVVGGLYNLACIGALAGAFSYAGLVYAFLLKLVLRPSCCICIGSSRTVMPFSSISIWD